MTTTERDWEGMARALLEKNVAGLVHRIRQAADQIEREAERNITNAAKPERSLEFQTYTRAAGQVLHELHAMIFNAHAEILIDAAADAEAVRAEKMAAADLAARLAATDAVKTAAMHALTSPESIAQQTVEQMGEAGR